MFTIFSPRPQKKFIVYDSSLNPYYEVRVNSVEDDTKLQQLLTHSRLFLKIEDTYYYRICEQEVESKKP